MNTAGLTQGVCVIAHYMENPEYRNGTAQVLRYIPMTPPHQFDQTVEVGRVPHILGLEGSSFDKIQYENAGFGVNDAWT